jgi:hypothetical protein
MVLPGGIAAYSGSMKATQQPEMIADKPESSSGKVDGSTTRR